MEWLLGWARCWLRVVAVRVCSMLPYAALWPPNCPGGFAESHTCDDVCRLPGLCTLPLKRLQRTTLAAHAHAPEPHASEEHSPLTAWCPNRAFVILYQIITC